MWSSSKRKVPMRLLCKPLVVESITPLRFEDTYSAVSRELVAVRMMSMFSIILDAIEPSMLVE